jgi:hypothetical protein
VIGLGCVVSALTRWYAHSRVRTIRLIREFGLLTCYLDEAGGEQDKSTVVCGWVSPVALWDQFEIDWKLFLASYKVSYLHMKEFSQSKGPFTKWKGRELIRRRFIQDAHTIIQDRARRWVPARARFEVVATIAKLCGVNVGTLAFGAFKHGVDRIIVSPR